MKLRPDPAPGRSVPVRELLVPCQLLVRARSLGGPIRIILVILGLCARGDENTI
jgi:hypothetical protein